MATNTRLTAPSSPQLSRTPLVGRDRELLLIRQELEFAVGGRRRLVLLGGEAGIGKTALARELFRDAEGGGIHVLAGHCYDLSNTPPYGPWLELFRDNRYDLELPTLLTAFEDERSARVTDRSALFADVLRFIADLAAVRPACILLEDLHWADPASIELLRYVSRALNRLPVLIVATYRLNELTLSHTLYRHLPALVREGDAVRLEPGRLDTDAFRMLVAARYRLSQSDEARLVSYLEVHADGNPFFAVELLRALEGDGLLRSGDDRSALGELARVVVPTLVRQVIDGRVARLAEEMHQPLVIAAVIGHEVPLKLWSELAQLDEETLLTIVERLVRAHLIEADDDGTHIRFVHALTREAIYDGILPPRRNAWHRRVGEALSIIPGVEPDAVAMHFQQAGDSRAWEWLVRAGDQAQRVYAWLTASERIHAAAALLKGVEGQERTYRDLVFRISYLVRFSDPDASIRALDEVEHLANLDGDIPFATEVQFIRGICLCYSDRFRTGLATMLMSVEVLESLPVDPARATIAIRDWFTEVVSTITNIDLTEDEQVVRRLYSAGLDFRRGTYSWHLATVGQVGRAVALAEQLVNLFADGSGARGGVRNASAFAYRALGISLAALGQPAEARLAWVRSREVFDVVNHHVLIAFGLLDELQDIALTYGVADPGIRRSLAAEAEASLGRAGGALRPGVSPRLAWTACLVHDGRWDEADQILDDLPDPGNAHLRRPVTASIAQLACHRGEPDLAWAQINAFLPDGPATEPGNNIHQEGLFLQRMAVKLCLDSGDVSRARPWLEAHDRWLGWGGSVLGSADGRLNWAYWYREMEDPARSRALAAEALHLASAPDQPLVRLTAHRLLGEIATSGSNHAEAEAHLAAALDLAHLCETPFERALTLLALAELRAVSSERDSVLPVLEEARGICLQLGAMPALAHADGLLAQIGEFGLDRYNPACLTKRELEVLRLLVQHHTDKEIAEALYISPHTASTHVKHILVKLDVASRREAAALAVDHSPI